ncbi:RNA polymerase sigma-70 factor [Mariniphaga sediminis]|jgi:RNA polymerase sigma-70 factor (ECF subfamily)|uniref:RNA polymerase sigma-70 factor n=1 Tax=Mariniphaga sediminis TaxID=1628158 RepID=A0A399D0A7_9BACT|nr:RNA polymerase sigma-70 factor [Mariniphaga sediminis]RIH65027.1 RNA polymerase sigma-70 factor [Mariniphaga sediminis]
MADIPGINEKTLVERLKNNEAEAFDRLFYRYSDKLYRFSFSLLKNEEDSREIIQEAFYKIWENRSKIDSSKSFKAFLFSISYHLIIDQLRFRLKDREFRKSLEKHFEEHAILQENKIDYNTLETEISKAVAELPEKRKQIYRLSREKGLTHKEIAEQLGIKTKTVENQINLALKHIKTHLGEDILAVLLFLSLFG